MIKKIIAICAVVPISFCLLSFVFSETIVLKSGKTVDGRIIERTDNDIKIDVIGVAVTYYANEIKSIDGKEFIQAGQSLDSNTLNGIYKSTAKDAMVTKEHNVSLWAQWESGIHDYTDKVEGIRNEDKALLVKMDREEAQARLKNETVQPAKTVSELNERASIDEKQLKELNPPEELKQYHQKLLEAYEYRKISSDAMLNVNLRRGRIYNHKSLVSEIEAAKEFRRVSAEHGAPKKELDVLDQVIAYGEESLEKNDPETNKP